MKEFSFFHWNSLRLCCIWFSVSTQYIMCWVFCCLTETSARETGVFVSPVSDGLTSTKCSALCVLTVSSLLFREARREAEEQQQRPIHGEGPKYHFLVNNVFSRTFPLGTPPSPFQNFTVCRLQIIVGVPGPPWCSGLWAVGWDLTLVMWTVLRLARVIVGSFHVTRDGLSLSLSPYVNAPPLFSGERLSQRSGGCYRALHCSARASVLSGSLTVTCKDSDFIVHLLVYKEQSV